MSFLDFVAMPGSQLARRNFLAGSGLVLSGTAIALLAGRPAMAKGSDASASDVRILNSALSAELEAVAAYQLGADSGLLKQPVRDLALTFQGHHIQHSELLAKTVRTLGGQPAPAKDKYQFPTEKLKSQEDVLRFAALLEKGAVSAYLGAVPILDNRELAKAAASILGDEAMHWAVLRNALGETPVPDAFVS